MLVRTTCIPEYTMQFIDYYGPNEIVLLGGPASLNAAVKNLTVCS
jgi:hypothetical protein